MRNSLQGLNEVRDAKLQHDSVHPHTRRVAESGYVNSIEHHEEWDLKP